jgi:uncharacterized membrane protein YdjX (TVP38/TMEM64 family)
VAAPADVGRLRRRALLRIGAAAALLLAVFVGARLAGLSPSAHGLQRWADGLGFLGPVLFVFAGVALNCAFVPIPVLATAAGLVFGTAEGTAVGVATVASSATLHLLIGRHLAGASADVLLGRRGAAIAEFLERRGFWAVLYVRLVPGLPFNSLNYAAGLSRLRARAMFAGTGLGFAPRTFAYAAVGGSITNLGSTEARVALAIGVAMAVVGAVLARRQIAAERRRRSGARGQAGPTAA